MSYVRYGLGYAIIPEDIGKTCWTDFLFIDLSDVTAGEGRKGLVGANLVAYTQKDSDCASRGGSLSGGVSTGGHYSCCCQGSLTFQADGSCGCPAGTLPDPVYNTCVDVSSHQPTGPVNIAIETPPECPVDQVWSKADGACVLAAQPDQPGQTTPVAARTGTTPTYKQPAGTSYTPPATPARSVPAVQASASTTTPVALALAEKHWPWLFGAAVGIGILSIWSNRD